ncbi:hypothetical protein QM565_18625 [Geitlerinema splendidum]|nr:hypothetical protein [Geitlerinema splendidum]
MMAIRRGIPSSLALIGASLVALGAALPSMVYAIRDHNREAQFDRFAFQRIQDDSFEYVGLPVRVGVGESGDEGRAVEVSWRGETLRVPLTGKDDERLPELLRFESWLRAYQVRTLPAGVDPQQAILSPSTPDDTRMIFVARHPSPGGDEKYVDRKAWTYEIVELRRPDATREPEPLPAPKPVARGTPPETTFEATEAFARWTFTFAALPSYERTWQYQAALDVTPSLAYPRNKFRGDGMSSVGWTWPLAGLGMLGLLAGLVRLGSCFVSREAVRRRTGGASVAGA